MPPEPSNPQGGPPRPPTNPVRAVFTMGPAQRRWPFGVKAGFSTAAMVTAGWTAGNVAAGLIGSIGTFTSRYGNSRPYLNRGIQLAVVALSLALAISLGVWAAPVPWAGVLVVSLVAVAAVWLCNALAVGPPGGYLFVVACAAGIGISASQLGPLRVGLLVLAGGALAWLVQMVGALVDFRGPERSAVAGTGEAVAAYIEATGTPAAGAARHRAAASLHETWSVLVNFQPVTPPPASDLNRLRAANHALHVLFADAMTAAADGEPQAPDAAAQARRLGTMDLPPETVATRDIDRIPLGRPPLTQLLRQAVTPGSQTRHVMLRVAIAVPLAGAVAASLGVGRAYWAMAAAVLVLHQGFDWTRTLQRGAERLLGTWIGLGLAAVIILIHPQGLWLALVLALLQFTVEMLVVRNYTLATIFITAAALTISTGSRQVDVGPLLISRGVDTAIGCAVGILVYLAVVRRQETTRLTDAIADTLDAIAVTSANLARGDAASLPARTARRDLQRAATAVVDAYDAATGGSGTRRKAAEPMWPLVEATEHLAYRVIAACWAMDRATDGRPGAGLDTTAFDAHAADLRATLAATPRASRRGVPRRRRSPR
ncbi:MAG: FUSC family protein [Mycobacterium sp.]